MGPFCEIRSGMRTHVNLILKWTDVILFVRRGGTLCIRTNYVPCYIGAEM
jgi:hypothetical protein